MRFVSLFAGIGGIDLGLERAGHECVGQVELDEYATRVLEKHWPTTPRIRDVRDFHGHEFGAFDLLTGGYPCQPFSMAGQRKGEDDHRHLWPEVLRIVRNVRPRYALLENVPGHLSLGFGRVLGDLAESGYDAEWDCIPAAAIGAPHLRDRVFILAYPNGERCEGNSRVQPPEGRRVRDAALGPAISVRAMDRGAAVADSHSRGRIFGQAHEHATDGRVYAQRHARASREAVADTDSQQMVGTPITWGERHPWQPEPDVGRVANGVPKRVDRIRGLGNSVVPQVAEWIGRRLPVTA